MQLCYILLGEDPTKERAESDILMTDMNFGEMLRTRRKELGLSQEDTAAKAGLSVMTYGRIERGMVGPKLDQIRRIFSVLGLNLDAIEKKVEDRLTATECLNRIEFYVAELRKVIGR